MLLRTGLTLVTALLAGVLSACSGRTDSAPGERSAVKTLRVSFPVAETTFDPAQINDLYSRTVTAHIFEGLYRYDHLARPARIRPATARGMPEVSGDFRTWTIRVSPGIRFAPDAAFKGEPRELVAADYAYAIKRFADPATRSPLWGTVDELGIEGLAQLRERALASRQPFDYDAPVEGLRAVDRYTLQIRLRAARPRLLETLASGDVFGAVAREVVDFYGADIGAHPVGTGPFRLGAWRRSSLIVLERNPAYRELHYEEQASPGDASGQAISARLAGRRLPLVDRVEVSIIEEQQPRWLAFLNGQIDLVAVPGDFVNTAMPNGELSADLRRKGIQAWRVVQPDTALTYFNMDDPLVGGYTPEKVALRRAIGLATDVDREIRLVRRGQAVVAHSPIVPHTTGYDEAFVSENGQYDPARANALLDVYGYVDRDADGWRDRPDGSPLVLRVATQPDQSSRQYDELWRRNMTAIGMRVAFDTAKWPEQLKQARSGKLMMWMVGSTAAAPDGQGALSRLHGPQSGGQNLSRFSLPAFDSLYARMSELADGVERDALFREAKLLAVAYMPYKFHVHRIVTDMAQPRVIGYRRPVFWNDVWQYIDVDDSDAAQSGNSVK